MQQAVLISGGIFIFVMLSTLGRRELSRKLMIRPLLIVAGVGYGYLHGAPTGGSALLVYVVGAAIGIAFGLVAAAFTKVEKAGDAVFTICGVGFVVTWLVAVALRIGFIFEVENNGGFRERFGEFMIGHHLSFDTIAPFFVLMALAMVLTRLGVIALRANGTSVKPREMVSAA